MEEINNDVLYVIDRTSNPVVYSTNTGITGITGNGTNTTGTGNGTNTTTGTNTTGTNTTGTTNSSNINEKKDFSQIVQLIRKKMMNGKIKEYHFRPYRIDGVFCYIVLYLKEKIMTIESINVKCNFTENHTVPYVLYHKKFKSIEKIIQLIHEIVTTYKIINGDLLSPKHCSDIKTEELLLPYNEDEVCSVCLEHTTDNTSCGHYICFSCRDKCIIQKKKNCPICRCSNALSTYHNSMQLINNVDYIELYDLFYNKMHRIMNDDEYDDDNNSVVSSSSDEDEEGEDEDSDEDSDEDDDGHGDDNNSVVSSSDETNELEEEQPVVIQEERMSLMYHMEEEPVQQQVLVEEPMQLQQVVVEEPVQPPQQVVVVEEPVQPLQQVVVVEEELVDISSVVQELQENYDGQELDEILLQRMKLYLM